MLCGTNIKIMQCIDITFFHQILTHFSFGSLDHYGILHDFCNFLLIKILITLKMLVILLYLLKYVKIDIGFFC